LIELASQGYVVLANGAAGPPGQSFPKDGSRTTAAMLTQSLNWIDKDGDGGKYGKIDKTRIAAAGQSCGGMEAMSISGDPRIKFTVMFNSGGLFGQSPVAKALKHPVVYLLGGTGDLAYTPVS
jgi:dienelactone hydrolase